MFKGLHQILHKPKPQTHTTPSIKASEIYPIQKASALLAIEKRHNLIKEMRSFLNLPAKLFDASYLKAIENYAEFCQSLPVTQSSAFSQDGGFLDYGLERATKALGLVLTHFFPQEKNLSKVSSLEALWIYAVFTAALFFDVGKIAVKYKIELCQKDGSLSKEWIPFAGPMTLHGKFYKYSFIKENYDRLQRLVNPLLARQLLATDETSTGEDGQAGSGSSGFNWLASNPVILEAWLTMLGSDGRAINTFMTLIPLAEAQILQNYFDQLKDIATSNLLSNSLFDNLSDDAKLQTTIAGGEAFLRWLQQALANGTITTNGTDSLVHMTEDGALMSAEIFKKFSEQNPQHRNPDSVAQQFYQMMEAMITPVGDIGKRYSQIGGVVALQAMHNFLLIHNPHLLFAMGKIPPSNPNIVKVAQQQHVTAEKQIKQDPHANLQHR